MVPNSKALFLELFLDLNMKEISKTLFLVTQALINFSNMAAIAFLMGRTKFSVDMEKLAMAQTW